MKLFALLLALALGGLGYSGVALAAPPTFEEVDINADGMITPEEAAMVEGLDFEAADLDGDGVLSPDEYEAWRQEQPDSGQTA
jgi:hypothetical protein